ncbi:hypothetical protein X975_08407, partial [Stegodyphus mimosarum]
MTEVLLNDWFENLFIPEALQNLVGLPDGAKIVLIANNCLAHTSLKVLVKDNVSVLNFGIHNLKVFGYCKPKVKFSD